MLRVLLFMAVLLCLLSAQMATAIAQVAKDNSETTTTEGDSLYKLSPFVVSTEGDEGFASRQTSLSTRSAKNLLEIPSSLVVINSELLKDWKPTGRS
jgi:outer membrane receptor for ferric coprogen and ferric-rhodotorulic acid